MSSRGPLSKSVLIWSSAFAQVNASSRAGLHTRNCFASIELNDDALDMDVRK
jgi:hypothetical protein